MLPGVGTKDDIRAAPGQRRRRSAGSPPTAPRPTSPIQHFGLARELGLETVGFLMMSHTQPPEVLAKQARIMVDAGCQCVYVVDSAGALVMEQTGDRVAALVAEIGDEAAGRLPRPREPRPRRRQHGDRRPRRRHPDRRLGPPLRRRRRQHAARGVRRRLRQARLDAPASTSCRSSTPSEDVDPPGHARGVPARPDDADDGLRRRLQLVPQARRQRRRAVRRLRRQDPARGRPSAS